MDAIAPMADHRAAVIGVARWWFDTIGDEIVALGRAAFFPAAGWLPRTPSRIILWLPFYAIICSYPARSCFRSVAQGICAGR
jgi:hypothetical protein